MYWIISWLILFITKDSRNEQNSWWSQKSVCIKKGRVFSQPETMLFSALHCISAADWSHRRYNICRCARYQIPSAENRQVINRQQLYLPETNQSPYLINQTRRSRTYVIDPLSLMQELSGGYYLSPPLNNLAKQGFLHTIWLDAI